MKIDVAAKFDVIVIGSGISGLICALELGKNNKSVCLITKEAVTESSSLYAQGGISVPLGKFDSVDKHLEDTLRAGTPLCDLKNANQIISRSIYAFEKLISYGVKFDLNPESENVLHQTKEAAHSVPRVVHVGGDASGRIITKTLIDKVCREPNISISQGTCVLSLLKDPNGNAFGVLVEDVTKNKYIVLGKNIILASGGVGQLYKYTTNPVVCTGDGIAMAYRAGVCVQDLEMIQFHPTVFLGKGDPFLVTEAIRGEGGRLKNINGEYFAKHYHELGELAPRDVLARAILAEMGKTMSGFVYLDLSTFKEEYFINRFPTIYKECLNRNIALFEKGIPVSPAAHYLIGGIKTDVFGSTNISALWAIGEVASSGFHGANRLASNSLLECIVVPHLLVERLLSIPEVELPQLESLDVDFDSNSIDDDGLKSLIKELQDRNTKAISLLRNKNTLNEHLQWLTELESKVNTNLLAFQYQVQELKNMILLSKLITKASIFRDHSLGVHYREDCKELSKEFKHSIFNENKQLSWEIQKNESELVPILK